MTVHPLTNSHIRPLLWFLPVPFALVAAFCDTVISGPGYLEPIIWCVMVFLCTFTATLFLLFRALTGNEKTPFLPTWLSRTWDAAWPAWAVGIVASMIILRADPSRIMRMDYYLPFIWLCAYGLGWLAAAHQSKAAKPPGIICFLAGLLYGWLVFWVPFLHSYNVWFVALVLAVAHTAATWTSLSSTKSGFSSRIHLI